MWKKTIIEQGKRGLVFREGSYVRMLQPGTYRYTSWSKENIWVLALNEPFHVEGKDLKLFLHDNQLMSELDVVQVQDYEYVLRYEDGKFVELLRAGTYAFWNVLKKQQFIRIDIRQPEVSNEVETVILHKLSSYVQTFHVEQHEVGLLYYNNVLQRELKPGRYYFWKGAVQVSVETVDLRQQQLDMTGQEMMTEDKVTLRINFVCQYKIVNPLRVQEVRSFESQMYIQLQLVLREYVGTMKLDELLKMKQEIATFVLERLNEKSQDYGVEYISAGVKDIILPGDIKEILNTVLLAEKKAQANLITRREETASTRSLLNTAKLMDENQTLFRLKELEFLEKICEKIGTISLTGGGNLLEHLNSLLGAKPNAS